MVLVKYIRDDLLAYTHTANERQSRVQIQVCCHGALSLIYCFLQFLKREVVCGLCLDLCGLNEAWTL